MRAAVRYNGPTPKTLCGAAPSAEDFDDAKVAKGAIQTVTCGVCRDVAWRC